MKSNASSRQRSPVVATVAIGVFASLHNRLLSSKTDTADFIEDLRIALQKYSKARSQTVLDIPKTLEKPAAKFIERQGSVIVTIASDRSEAISASRLDVQVVALLDKLSPKISDLIHVYEAGRDDPARKQKIASRLNDVLEGIVMPEVAAVLSARGIDASTRDTKQEKILRALTDPRTIVEIVSFAETGSQPVRGEAMDSATFAADFVAETALMGLHGDDHLDSGLPSGEAAATLRAYRLMTTMTSGLDNVHLSRSR